MENSGIIYACALPHPPLAVPEVGGAERDKISKTLDSFDRVAREIAELAPETLIVVTPHSIVYSDYFHISPGDGAKGDLSRFRAPDVRFDVTYDSELAAEIAGTACMDGLPCGSEGERDAKLDHGVTVPLWFINKHYTDYKLVRISQSGLEPAAHYRLGQAIGAAVEKLGRRAAIIASADMSHKTSADGPYGFAQEGVDYDSLVADILASGDFRRLFAVPAELREKAAECGHNSYATLAGCFDGQSVDAELLSYEAPFGVGYAVAAFKPRRPDAYQELARKSLEHRVRTGTALLLSDDLPKEMLETEAGVFVSLHINGRLRGCIGTIGPTTACVASEIVQNAVSAGLRDPRFHPVSEQELPLLTYKVDVLSPAEPISDPEELDVKRYGVIVSDGARRGLLLPNLDGVDTVEEQIDIAREKAGIPKGAKYSLERFEVIRHE